MMLLASWLGHADARQVFDLPEASRYFTGLRPGRRPEDILRLILRQVSDLPRIGTAESLQKAHRLACGFTN